MSKSDLTSFLVGMTIAGINFHATFFVLPKRMSLIKRFLITIPACFILAVLSLVLIVLLYIP